MAHAKREIGGSQATAVGNSGGVPPGVGGDNAKSAKFWVSHRQGPFLIHEVDGCEPEGNVGFGDDYDNLIEQGFAPCPKCIGGTE